MHVRAGPEPVIYQCNKIEPRFSECWVWVTDVGVYDCPLDENWSIILFPDCPPHPLERNLNSSEYMNFP